MNSDVGEKINYSPKRNINQVLDNTYEGSSESPSKRRRSPCQKNADEVHERDLEPPTNTTLAITEDVDF